VIQEEECRLYLYTSSILGTQPTITKHFALSSLPFEFPTINPAYSMISARFIYGCSTTTTSFGTALGEATNIDVLLKADVTRLLRDADRKHLPNGDCLDQRSMEEILRSTDTMDPIKAFRMPRGWYAQETTYVSRCDNVAEDDGFLLFYVFDESQLEADGECRKDAESELWIISAKDMQHVIARVRLPQRVLYGMHGGWFSETMIKNQRPVQSYKSFDLGRHATDGIIEWMTSWLG
jgi:carotenoid cleavage dioxygenase-like enzyme